MKSLRGAHFLHLACQGGGAHPWPPVSYATGYNAVVWWTYQHQNLAGEVKNSANVNLLNVFLFLYNVSVSENYFLEARYSAVGVSAWVI